MKPHCLGTRRLTAARRGSILICVLVCLAVTTAIVTSTVRSALDARQAMRTQHRVRQTELLLAAGIDRAARQLQKSDDYDGEPWRLPPEVVPGVESAEVTIEVTPADDDAVPAGDDETRNNEARQVHVTARLAITEQITIQRSYSFPLDSP